MLDLWGIKQDRRPGRWKGVILTLLYLFIFFFFFLNFSSN